MPEQKHYRSRGAKAALANSPLFLLSVALLVTSCFTPVLAQDSGSSPAGDASTQGKDSKNSAEENKALDKAAKALAKDARASAKRARSSAKDSKSSANDTGASASDANKSAKSDASKSAKDDASATKASEPAGKAADAAAGEAKKQEKAAKKSAKEAKTPAKEAKSPVKSGQPSHASEVAKSISRRVAGFALGSLGGMPVCWYQRLKADEMDGINGMSDTRSHFLRVCSGIVYAPLAAMDATFECPFYSMRHAFDAEPFTKEQFSLGRE
jgi:hypothetical protein